MKLNEAIKILDEVIPPPHNKMVDSDHMKIAIAWREIKTRAALLDNEKLQEIRARFVLAREKAHWVRDKPELLASISDIPALLDMLESLLGEEAHA